MSFPTEVEFDSSLPTIDREQLEMLLMADEGEDATALVREIYGLFRKESDEKLAQLDAICEGKKLLQLRNAVHFVAGSAGNLGMVRLHAYLRAIEEGIDLQRITEPCALVATIRSEYANSCEAFEQELLA